MKNNTPYKDTICDLCNLAYSKQPFVNMDATGSYTYSTLLFNDEEFDICPKCTKKILLDKITKL